MTAVLWIRIQYFWPGLELEKIKLLEKYLGGCATFSGVKDIRNIKEIKTIHEHHVNECLQGHQEN